MYTQVYVNNKIVVVVYRYTYIYIYYILNTILYGQRAVSGSESAAKDGRNTIEYYYTYSINGYL